MKRSRFTAHTSHPRYGDERKVILAYDPFSVQAHYERQGYHVHGVERGDYRKQQRVAEVRANAQTWRIDRAALREVIEFLGITLPVSIRQTSRVGGQQGCHNFKPSQGAFKRDRRYDTARGTMTHHITVKDYIGADRASEVIWHELCHAMQAERAIEDAGSPADLRDQFEAWAACKQKGVYRMSRIEVEARSYEAHAAEIKPAI